MTGALGNARSACAFFTGEKEMKCFDAHSDIWTDVTIKRLKGETNVFHNHHFERLQKGGVEGTILVLWVDPPHIRDYAKRTHEIFSCVSDEIAEAKDFRIVKTYDEMMKAREDGVFYIMIGVEGMAYASYDPTFAKLDEYYDFGARHGMLTWKRTASDTVRHPAALKDSAIWARRPYCI